MAEGRLLLLLVRDRLVLIPCRSRHRRRWPGRGDRRRLLAVHPERRDRRTREKRRLPRLPGLAARGLTNQTPGCSSIPVLSAPAGPSSTPPRVPPPASITTISPSATWMATT